MELHMEDWGCLAYAEAFERQRALVAERLEAKCPDTLVFVEHEPVFTLGARTGAAQHLLWNADDLRRHGVEVIETNRGGDITYHGPGQLVAYPIINLTHRRNLHAWLRFLEDVLINVLKTYALKGTRREGKTGIWIDTRKIAAIGVAVRQWVTYHGFALNVAPDLSHFSGIIPCGIQSAEGSVTSLEIELGYAPAMEEVKTRTQTAFTELFQLAYVTP